LIHDACRPFLSTELRAGIKEAIYDRSYGAWVPVVPVVETLKILEGVQVVETIDRQKIFRAQTPQIFEFTVLRSAFQKARETELSFTDDASLCESFGVPVGTFPGDVRNLKLTYEFEKEAVHSLVQQEEKNPCIPESDSTFTG
jgi:2-C-methyl-D-erythritol 4-phosphate cytidylyltransferase